MDSETQHRADSEFIFRPRGHGRFPVALFRSMWLCRWAVGEVFVLSVLGQGIGALLSGRSVIGSGDPGRIAGALGAGPFLLVWLVIWTFGGVVAVLELLRLLGRRTDRTKHDRGR